MGLGYRQGKGHLMEKGLIRINEKKINEKRFI